MLEQWMYFVLDIKSRKYYLGNNEGRVVNFEINFPTKEDIIYEAMKYGLIPRIYEIHPDDLL